MKKNLLDINIYILGILLDSFAVFLILQTTLGASPFGLLVSNLALVLPITIGVASLLYDFFNITVAAALNKSRITYENLLYGFIFAVFLQLFVLIMPSFDAFHIVFKVGILISGFILADLAKALLNLVKYPKLSTVVLIYAVANKLNINLNWASKILNLNNILWGIIFSIIAGVPFNNFGIGTIISVLFLGIFLKIFDPIIKKLYTKLTQGKVELLVEEIKI